MKRNARLPKSPSRWPANLRRSKFGGIPRCGPLNQGEGLRDHWDLAFARCYNAMQYLIQQGIEPERIRLGSAGAFEPLDTGLDPEERKRNARVEVLMWDERVMSPGGG